MYGYSVMGLGTTTGNIAGWCLVWAYLFIGTAGMTGFTIFATTLLGMIGIHVPQIVLFVVCAASIWYLGYRDIRLSSGLMLIIEGLSVALIILLCGIVLFGQKSIFDTNQITLQGGKGEIQFQGTAGEQVAVEDDSSSSYDRNDYTFCIRVVTDLEMAPGKIRTYKQYFRPICRQQLADMIEDQARNMTQEELAKFRSLPLAEKLAFRVERTDAVKTEFPGVADDRVEFWLAQVPLPRL